MGLLDTDPVLSLNADPLDVQELIELVITSYDVLLDDADLERVSTVGDLAELIERGVSSPQTDRCLSAYVFLEIRKALVESGTINRRQVRPSTEIETVLSQWWRRRSQWKPLFFNTGFDLPSLQHPGAVQLALFVLAAGLTFTGVGFTTNPLNIGEWASAIFVAVIGTLILFVLLLGATGPWLATSPPQACRTFADLARVVLARNHAQVVRRCGGSNLREIFGAIRTLITCEFCVDPNRITRHTPFF